MHKSVKSFSSDTAWSIISKANLLSLFNKSAETKYFKKSVQDGRKNVNILLVLEQGRRNKKPAAFSSLLLFMTCFHLCFSINKKQESFLSVKLSHLHTCTHIFSSQINYSLINEYPVFLEHTHSSSTAQIQHTHTHKERETTLCFGAVCLTYFAWFNEKYYIITTVKAE